VALTLLTVILERVKVCITDTHNRRDASYNLNVEWRHVVGVRGWGIITVTLLWSEIMGSYNTPNTMVQIGA